MNITLDDKTLEMLNKIAGRHDNEDLEFVIHGAIQYFILLHVIPTEDQLLVKDIINKHCAYIEILGLQ
jgi:hypothetical protein